MKAYPRAGVGFAALLMATFSAVAATQRDNFVNFAVNGIKTFMFTETCASPPCHSITSGQESTYGGTTSGVGKPGAGGFIDVKAGRKGSSSVASWFQQRVGTGQTLACDSKGNFPKELNFAVEGTLTMTLVDGSTVTCSNIIIAQGHFLTVNNWWVGGPGLSGTHVSLTGVTGQACAVTGGTVPTTIATFTPQTPCVNNFSIGFIPSP